MVEIEYMFVIWCWYVMFSMGIIIIWGFYFGGGNEMIGLELCCKNCFVFVVFWFSGDDYVF